LKETAMQSQAREIVDLERKFWQSIVDEDTDTALGMLADQSLMVSSHGAMKFGHVEYRKMAEQGKKVLKNFVLSDLDVVFPNDTTAIVARSTRNGRCSTRIAPTAIDNACGPLISASVAAETRPMRALGVTRCINVFRPTMM